MPTAILLSPRSVLGATILSNLWASGYQHSRAGLSTPRTYRMRVDLGTIGVWTTYRAIGAENAGEAARLVEELGFGTFWLGGSPRLSSVRPLLEATETLVVATGIVNVWAYDPAELAAEYVSLARDFPERLLVGIG